MFIASQGNCGYYFDFYGNQANPNAPDVTTKVRTCSAPYHNITYEPQYSFSTFFTPTSTASSIELTIPSNGQVTNDFNYWTVHYVAATSSAHLKARVIYYDAYGFYRVDTSVPVAPNSDLVMNLAKTNALAPHEYLAQAQLIHDDGTDPVQVLAQSGWNTFNIVLANYGEIIATTTAQIEGGFFTLQNCADPTISSSTLSEITCNVTNSFKSFGNTIFSNVSLIFKKVGTLLTNNIFPFSTFSHISYDLRHPIISTSTSAAPIIPRGASGDNPYFTFSSGTIQTAANKVGLHNYRDLIDYLMYGITGAIIIILSIVILLSLKPDD
jgi:hypothetical protein